MTRSTAFYRAKGRKRIPDRVAHYSERMGVTASGVRILELRNRWASCTSKGRLSACRPYCWPRRHRQHRLELDSENTDVIRVRITHCCFLVHFTRKRNIKTGASGWRMIRVSPGRASIERFSPLIARFDLARLQLFSPMFVTGSFATST